MKKIFKNLGGALMLAAALVFTSCDGFKSFIDNPVSSYLEVNPESVTLKVGEEKTLEVTTISDQPISYTSSNKDVATVDEKGVITAVSEGAAIITVSVASTDTYAAGMKQVQVKVVPAPIQTIPLTIEAKAENGAKVKLKKNDSYELKTIKYKKSTDPSWKDYKFDDEISLNKGESVSFWSNNAALGQTNEGWTYYSYFVISDECYVYGNVMSMIDDQEGATAENPKFSTDEEIGASYAFYNLFRYCTKILNHESKELVLPATKLASNCYQGMFYHCEKLTKAPELKAEKLEDYCYRSMFSYCTSLTKAPELKAETLTRYCYSSMFSGCSSLTKAPDLKAKTLASFCYSSMFSGCSSLTDAPEIAAEIVAPYCCQSMFNSCSSLTKGPVLKAKKLEEACYNAMFQFCSKLGSLTCLATDISADYCVLGWLSYAGYKAEGDKKLYVDPSMTEANWNLGSGWTVAPAVN
ncbi:MAG: Ig-like domain-containing protein [Prevotella sp.]|nr:Ig-like domain-containing protein [Prevotella sp.]